MDVSSKGGSGLGGKWSTIIVVRSNRLIADKKSTSQRTERQPRYGAEKREMRQPEMRDRPMTAETSTVEMKYKDDNKNTGPRREFLDVCWAG